MEQLLKDFLEAISPAFQIFLQGAAMILAGQLILWLRNKYQTEKVNLSREQEYLLELVAGSAVRAAEQVYADNKEKLNFAVNVTEKALAGYGVKLDLDVIVAEIESQVYRNFQPESAG